MKVIITGTTGMVGEGVLLVCLNHPQITSVMSVSRKPTGITHPKLEEYIVKDFLALNLNDPKLKGYDACFFCAGISSVGMKEAEYRKITYDTTLHFAHALAPNPGLSFVYVSGGGTDSSEKGRMMWARVKGKTENDLMKLPFKHVFAFRPGFMKAVAGQQHLPGLYKKFSWLFPAILKLLPGISSTLQQVADAMIVAVQNGYGKKVIEIKDIKRLAARAQQP